MKNSILGFGAMRLPQIDAANPASINMEEFEQMVDYYMEQGFDYLIHHMHIMVKDRKMP